MFDELSISLPKQNSRKQAGWGSYFPYYAGFSERFALDILTSARLSKNSIVCDPWNGSGTTTFVASSLGIDSLGFDLNPIMVIIARARLLAPTEADSIEPLSQEVVKQAITFRAGLHKNDPLFSWFSARTAGAIRGIERSIRHNLVGKMTVNYDRVNIEYISGLAATFYVALFAVCRKLAGRFRSSNPTWYRVPKAEEPRIERSFDDIAVDFKGYLVQIAEELAKRRSLFWDRATSIIKISNTTNIRLPNESIDLVLTSPPYCTRIDYTAATRVEIAVAAPLIRPIRELARLMIGSTKVPAYNIDVSSLWGSECATFLEQLRHHPSKASSGYYYLNHLDYFNKLSRSFGKISKAIKPNGAAIVVVQDSYYKELRNDLPEIVRQMAERRGLSLMRRDDFKLQRSMSGINPHTRTYRGKPQVVEAVLCFKRQ
jgi:DNA modification methylase